MKYNYSLLSLFLEVQKKSGIERDNSFSMKSNNLYIIKWDNPIFRTSVNLF